MPDAKGKELVRRYDQLQQAQANFRARWSLLAKFFAPSRYGFQSGSTVSVGENILKDVFDSSALFAADIFGNFLSGKVINRADKWCGVRAANPALRGEDEVKEWLEESRDRLLDDYAASNFYAQATEAIKDYGVFATGSLYGGERPYLPTDPPTYGYRGSHYACQPIGRYVIAENAAGENDTQMCEIRMSARAATQSWPKGDFSEAVKKALVSDQDKEFDFIYAVYPRPSSDRFGKYGNKRMPYAACYVEKEAGQTVWESGFEQFQFTTARYGKRWGEQYGRGFGELALHDVQTLNLAKKMGFEDWALKIRPPVMARDRSVVGTLRIRPASLNLINTHGQAIQNSIMPWQTGSHPEVSQIKEEALRQSIFQIFYVSQVLKLLEIENLRDMTATAYLQTLNLLFGLLGPIYGALESEFLRPRVEADFFRLYREGVFSDPPDILLETGGNIQIEFQNPLSRAQRMGELDALDAMLLRFRPLAEMEMSTKQYSEIMDWIDIDKTAQKIADVTGAPASVIRSWREVEALRQARNEKDKEAMADQQMALLAQSAGKAAPFIKAIAPPEEQAA